MDDITILVPSQIVADVLLQSYYDFYTWAGIMAEPKNSRSLSLVVGSMRAIHFKVGGDTIPTFCKKPLKSLRHLFSIQLIDRYRGTEVQKVAVKGLKSIVKTCLRGNMNAWCYQYSLLPCLLWTLQMYGIALSRVEQIQQYNNKYLLLAWSSSLFFESRFICQFLKPTAPSIFTGRRN